MSSIHKLKALFHKRFRLPKERELGRAVRRFSPAEKTVFYILVGLFVFSGVALLYRVNDAFLVEVPARGGTLTEGVIGNPRFINPVLAFSEADKTLVSLIYSGLLKVDTQGRLENDLAQSVSVSQSGLVYSVTLKPGLTFQDGSPLSADDVIFTVNKILDQNVKSPLYGDWSGVTVGKTGDLSLTFTLKKPYAPFLNNLTVGILPKGIWSAVSDDEFAFSQFNTLPVGSGPYMIDTVTRNSGGIPDYYDLVPFGRAVGDEPYIAHYVFRFYPSDSALVDAYRNGDIDSLSGVSPETAEALKSDAEAVYASPLPRVFGVFLNQSQNKALADADVRKALDLTAPRDEIVADVLHGYGTAISTPLPPSLFPWAAESAPAPQDERLAEAAALLARDGWTKNPQTGLLEKKSKKDTIPLSFTISTGNAPELRDVADKLVSAWRKLGAEVDMKVFETGDLNQNVIRPRNYEALLFGEVLGRDADIYPFWHSSQRNDPGLNIALYANPRVDKLLDEIRSTTNPNVESRDYQAFNDEIAKDLPEIALYSPNFVYLAPKDVKHLSLGSLASPEDRFASARDWYLETDNVWKLFVK